MQVEKPLERASRIAQEAEAFRDCIDVFESAFDKLWRNPVRRSVVADIELAIQRILEKAKKEENDIQQHPETLGTKVVRICADSVSNGSHPLKVSKSEGKYARGIAEDLLKQGPIEMSPSDFVELVSNLKTLILEGKLDDKLHLTVENLIYDHLAKAASKTAENKSTGIGAETHS